MGWCERIGVSSAAYSLLRASFTPFQYGAMPDCEDDPSESTDEGAQDMAPKVIDASWFLPDTPFAPPHGVDSPRGHYDSVRIPGAAFWDADADSNPEFSITPHNLPLLGVFGARMASIGVTPTRPVVVYDQHGMFSAPRLWYVAALLMVSRC